VCGGFAVCVGRTDEADFVVFVESNDEGEAADDLVPLLPTPEKASTLLKPNRQIIAVTNLLKWMMYIDCLIYLTLSFLVF